MDLNTNYVVLFNHVTVHDLDIIETSVEFLRVGYKKYLWKM